MSLLEILLVLLALATIEPSHATIPSYVQSVTCAPLAPAEHPAWPFAQGLAAGLSSSPGKLMGVWRSPRREDLLHACWVAPSGILGSALLECHSNHCRWLRFPDDGALVSEYDPAFCEIRADFDTLQP